ncbi:efflux RND transporter periplasmic adaptor subunit [Thermomonas sp.]|uniref:efflux RND transporter periplasmic adaptor subunit n=1 Tax=Thermomonas sp. TaxID=1971895 RepID=UPI002D0FA4AC|nr:efflux RND transporter periplasmic adaptor subunit [Thermomonas sp.]HRO63751.1 efflux RND transporter periplasmic adaptor subunit [Thermomonas sp.]
MRIKPMRRDGWALVLAALVLAGCDRGAQEAAPVPAQVSVLTLTARQVTLEDELPGRVAAVRTAEIRPQVGGIIQRRLFEQGAEIRAGQPLFQINPAPFKADADMASAALQRAEAALVRARVQAARLQPLVEADAVSRQVYDDAVSQRDQAAADVAQARATLARRQLDLKFATVDAPIGGRIDQALVTEGALVGTNDSNPLARIQQIDQVYVDVRQPAAALEALRAALAPRHAADNGSGSDGLLASILRSNGTPYPQAGRILFSGINVDAGTGDVLLRILVDNPDRLLLPGMFVRARVPRGQPADALLVPQQAVSPTGGKAGVWVVDAQDHAQRLTVELGELVGRDYLVRSGLQAGQRVVVEGGERLTDGAPVAPRAWQAAGARAPAR